ncbi:MAG: helix-turn-helix transcriptional regulator [Pseudorhodoplanes sp.]
MKILRLLTTRQVCALVGTSRATLDRWRDDGSFPPPVVLRSRPNGRPTSIRWRPQDVEDWLASRHLQAP